MTMPNGPLGVKGKKQNKSKRESAQAFAMTKFISPVAWKRNIAAKDASPFWWDFSQDGKFVVVESLHPDHRVIASYRIGQSAEDAIDLAKKHIDDLGAGRRTLKDD